MSKTEHLIDVCWSYHKTCWYLVVVIYVTPTCLETIYSVSNHLNYVRFVSLFSGEFSMPKSCVQNDKLFGNETNL